MDQDKVIDLLIELRDHQQKTELKMQAHAISFEQHMKQDDQMMEEIREIKETLRENTDDVKYHIKRSDVLEKDQMMIIDTLKKVSESFEAMTKRIESLEAPVKAKKYLYKKWMDVFKIIISAGGAYAILSKYFNW